jgi:hypothetical protein
MLNQAQNAGDLSLIKRILAIVAVSDGTPYSIIAKTLKISTESIRLWVKTLLLKGVEGLKSKKPPGRPSKLTKTQRKELESLIIEGPAKAGFPGACWRSPMIAFTYFGGCAMLGLCTYVRVLRPSDFTTVEYLLFT